MEWSGAAGRCPADADADGCGPPFCTWSSITGGKRARAESARASLGSPEPSEPGGVAAAILRHGGAGA
jgi:hypothetical protein